ncbi:MULTISPECIES: formate dehydrogenase accessory sulfurtransferase FdhD [Sphingomonas]|jgi:FdhD protein|uniref:Sulfur carrier protein FdhD n=1 Tax=Sphingomonas hankookensis TaxID=563996 RepID=A0ABR5YCM4_9SPHN|nr:MULTISPECIES: formate dehydrogenase accessory sulfurtransferase FdhD [Sphingomonas]KZE15306.1 sufurtransferase FdhD [Sphingomonas hankookensis]PZT96422.1 MAG: formate dehydrogenase accessory sulfurtransferase FdhD [Sphingomonas sp.]RSV31743.1 formate dehydrogenase accessory sulfurtransferase FdhD [Sphingomonas sp. ABOLH]WCP71055.1 formate dehydrogenase accessory sulfurtransferase FdhD [Sphingomonas hankookensis]
MDQGGSATRRFDRVAASGDAERQERAIAIEAPVAIEVNGLGYAVLMATPTDLADLAYGFVLSERLVDDAGEVVEVSTHPAASGTLLRITLSAERHDRVAERVRHRISESSCGLCGIENLEQALRPLPAVSERSGASPAAIVAAAAALRDYQPLAQATGATHAAALCAIDGSVRLVREDVGRHNAFDKLIGAMRRAGQDWDGGFALLSSRCSYELVEKAVLANCPLLATLSAATSLALDRAASAGLPLRTLVRGDAMLAI